MKIVRQSLLFACLFFFSYCSAQEVSDLRRLYMSNNQILITFPANPTTGYVWSIVYYDQERLRLLGSQYMTPDKTKRIGAAGKMIYAFEVLNSSVYPFSSIIEFKYARPWDENNGLHKTAIITVKKARQKPSVKIQ